jgi:hypothetical protein
VAASQHHGVSQRLQHTSLSTNNVHFLFSPYPLLCILHPALLKASELKTSNATHVKQHPSSVQCYHHSISSSEIHPALSPPKQLLKNLKNSSISRFYVSLFSRRKRYRLSRVPSPAPFFFPRITIHRVVSRADFLSSVPSIMVLRIRRRSSYGTTLTLDFEAGLGAGADAVSVFCFFGTC